MKLNNKGFAISSIMYMILVLAVVLIALTLAILSSRKLVLDRLKKEVTNTIYEVYPLTYRETLNTLKEDIITYASANDIEKDSIKISELETSVDSATISGYKLDNKYLTVSLNSDAYDVYLGEEEIITENNTLVEDILDIVDYKIYGNSYQETSTQGKNLFNINSLSSTTNVINNNDGTLSVTAKSTSSGVGGNVTLFDLANLEVGKTYTLSADSTGTAKFIYLNKSAFIWYFGQSRQITQDDLDSDVVWYANGDNDTSFTAVVSNIQIEEGTKATEYEKFIPNSPSPNYPSKIESVGERTNNLLKIYGKTLGEPSDILESADTKRFYDYNTYVVGIGYNNAYAPYGINNYEITKNKVTLNVNSMTYGIGFPIKLEPGATYTFSYSNSYNVYPRLLLYNANGESTNFYNLKNKGNITLKDEEVYGVFLVNASEYNIDCYIENPQFVLGNTSTEYEPYGYRIPIKVSGKNLFNINKPNQYSSLSVTTEKIENGYIYTAKHSRAYNNYINYELDLSDFHGKQVTLSADVVLSDGNTGMFRIGYWSTSGTFSALKLKSVQNGNQVLTVQLPETMPENATSGYCIFFNVTTKDNMEGSTMQVTNIQVEIGDTATEYVPYMETKTSNIYLDESLRKIESYVDSIEFKNKDLTRKIKYREFDETDEWSVYASIEKHFQVPVGDNYFYKIDNFVLSNYYLSHHLKNTYYSNKDYAVMSVDGSRIRFKNKDYTTLEEWQAYLGTLNTPLSVMYAMSSQSNETVDLPEISTGIGTGTISVDTSILPSSVEFTVIKKIKQI